MSTKQNDSIIFRNIDRGKIEEQSYLVPRIGHSPMISVTSYGHSLDSSVTSYGHSPRLSVTLIARILKKKLKMKMKIIIFTIFTMLIVFLKVFYVIYVNMVLHVRVALIRHVVGSLSYPKTSG